MGPSVERLEEIGFQWKILKTFEERCDELLVFKEERGHCNVPSRYAGNPSLGYWVRNMRNAYKLIQAGMKARHNLSQDRIESLDEIGFEWQFLSIDYDDKTFENRCLELILFKEEFGHCNVSCKGADNKSLGNWCSDMRKAYKKIQNGMKSRYKLSQYRIDRLEGIGFQWEVHVPFEKRWLELIAFKVDFGHCNVPNRYLDNKSLGNWCTGMRTAYKRTKISQDKIE